MWLFITNAGKKQFGELIKLQQGQNNQPLKHVYKNSPVHFEQADLQLLPF
jgi:hypothetical protein